jgi:hypothetical protein
MNNEMLKIELILVLRNKPPLRKTRTEKLSIFFMNLDHNISQILNT